MKEGDTKKFPSGLALALGLGLTLSAAGASAQNAGQLKTWVVTSGIRFQLPAPTEAAESRISPGITFAVTSTRVKPSRGRSLRRLLTAYNKTALSEGSRHTHCRRPHERDGILSSERNHP
jgi:hypothetical protein